MDVTTRPIASAPPAPPDRPAPRRVLAARWAPPVALAAGVLLIGLVVALAVNVRITYILLDETLIKQSAVHYTQGLPHNLFHDLTARATSRLYSLLISPLVAVTHGDVAVRAARGLNAPLFASAAVPAFLLGRQVLRSRWAAVAAALLCVAFPWLALSTAMFTENLAYPLFLWAVLAMVWAYRAPSPARDLLAIALIVAATCARAQLVALSGAYVVIVLLRLWHDRPASAGAVGPWARRAARRFPVLLVLAVLAVLVAAWEWHQGALSERLRSLLGTYAATTSDRKSLPSDVGLSSGVEVFALALGTGIVPALLALSWYPRALVRPSSPSAHAFVVCSAVAVVVLFASTVYSQGHYLEGVTEERYYFYAAPFLWLGAFAAVESRAVSARAILEVGGALALVAVLVPLPRVLDTESSFFAPAIVATHHLLADGIRRFGSALGRTGLSERDALAVVVALATVGTAAAWRWAPRRGPWWTLAGAAAVQLTLTIVVFVAITGGVAGVQGRTGGGFAQLGFIDRATGDGDVTWVDNQPRSDEGIASGVQRTAMLYNDGLRQRVSLDALHLTGDNFPMDSLPLGTLQVDAASGRAAATPPLPIRAPYAVQTTDSPFLQLAGRRLGASEPLRLEALRLASPMRATWVATGLGVDGSLPPGQVARLQAWGPHSVTLRLTAAAPTTVRVRLGGPERAARVQPGRGRALALRVCEPVRGVLRADGPIVVQAVGVRDERCG